jgi:hypothetical protein
MYIISHLNYLHVIIGTIIYFAIGALWFSVLFSKPWAAGHGIVMGTDEESKARMKKEMPKMMLINLVLSFIAVLILACLVKFVDIFTVAMGIKLGLVTSFYSTMSLALNHMYTRKSFGTFMIDAGYHIVSLVIVSVVLSIWV